MVEHFHGKEGVSGSSPDRGSSITNFNVRFTYTRNATGISPVSGSSPDRGSSILVYMTSEFLPIGDPILQARDIQRHSGWAALGLLGTGAVSICASVRYGDTTLGLLGMGLVTGAGMAFAPCDEATEYTDRQVESELTALTADPSERAACALQVWGVQES